MRGADCLVMPKHQKWHLNHYMSRWNQFALHIQLSSLESIKLIMSHVISNVIKLLFLAAAIAGFWDVSFQHACIIECMAARDPCAML